MMHSIRLRKVLLWSIFLFTDVLSSNVYAQLKVVTTTTDLKAIVQTVGAEWVSVDSIAKGTQDPHFIEAKPSFMVKTSKADLLIAIGLDLEVGWLPLVVRGARNPNIQPGTSGYLEVGPLVDPVDIPKQAVTRSDGDVHPLGNPHVTLDPIRAGKIALIIAKRLGELDPAHTDKFNSNASAFQKRLQEKTNLWSNRIESTGIKKIISYHKTLAYFFDRFQIERPIILEPKPGIPPTSGHILKVISVIREQKVPLILVENFFDPTVTKKIKSEVPTVRSEVVPVSVEGESGVQSIEALIERLVSAIEGKRP